MNSPDYNKDTHIKFQFLMAMKQTEIGDLIQVEAKPEQNKGEFTAEAMALPKMSETNAERNNQVLDALQEQKEMMMNNSQEQEQNQPEATKQILKRMGNQ